METEQLAKELHEAGREAVAKNLVVRTDVPTKGFIEWDQLTEEAREGRRVQARYLLCRFDIQPKGERLTKLAPLQNTLVAKFRVHNVRNGNFGIGKSSESVEMSPVYSSDPNSENYSFSQATPGGSIQLFITNPGAFGFFELNKEILIRFMPADA